VSIERPLTLPQEEQEQRPAPAPTTGGGSLPERVWRYLRYILRNIRENPILYLMVLPGVLYFLVFKYGPMYGATVAFKDYRVLDGIVGSPWVGFEHFETIFNSFYFGNVLANTLIISSFKILFSNPAAILMALLLNEVRTQWFKRSVQTVSYLPHFLSWVVVSGILFALLSPSNGLINDFIRNTGGKPIAFLSDPNWFRQVLIASDMWKSAGFGAIIYLAAMSNISPTLYEAAAVDGASRWQRIWHITLPGIMPVIVLVTLIDIGYILNAGFEQVFVLYSVPVYSVGDIIDTWVYRRGLESFQISVASAMGLFKGVVGLVLIVSANWAARRLTGSGIFN